MSGDKRMVVVPDDFSDVDEIGYIEHGDGLVEMIRSVQAKGSFTIGVFGQWGQGKTSMLRQIKRGLNENEKENNEKEILTVWFNPWQFTGEEHIIIPFFHTLVSYLDEFIKEKESKGKAITEGIRKFFKELAHVPIALAYGMEGKVKIPLLLETKFSLKKTIDEARREKEEIEKKSEPDIKKLVDKYESVYYRLISKLQEVSRGLELKIVIFIDDLDRCLPEKAVELLEGLKVLLDLSGFVFVIGVAREVVEQGVRVRYKDLYSYDAGGVKFLEHDYLDKIIQFPLNLPPPDVDLLKSMVENYLKDITKAKPYLETIQKSLGTNPRCLKRAINTLSYTFWVSDKKEKRDENEEKKDYWFLPELLVKMTLIAFRFPAFYRVIGRTPHHLVRVQDFLEKKEWKRKEEKPVEMKVREISPKNNMPPLLPSLKRIVEESRQEKPDEGEMLDVPPEEKTSMGTGSLPKGTGFPEIDDLKLFESPNLESITEILAKQEREEGENDKGFETEEEVRRYVSLLSVTTTPEEAKGPVKGDLWNTMASRMVLIRAGQLIRDDSKLANELMAKLTGKGFKEFDTKFATEISPFLIDTFPVTQDLYEKIMGEDKNSSRFKGGDRPVEQVSWFDAVQFCIQLSEQLGYKKVYTIEGEEVKANFEANGFRLPTEAEWEYACRAGTSGERYGDIDQIAWYSKNSNGLTQGVGKLKSNDWGLYDMLGNVWEWCWDWYGDYPKGSQKDWGGPAGGSKRVYRGGGWLNGSGYCSSVLRSCNLPTYRASEVGFRLARSNYSL